MSNTGTTQTYDFFIPAPARMLTTNAERKMHWSLRAEIVRAWRLAGWLDAAPGARSAVASG